MWSARRLLISLCVCVCMANAWGERPNIVFILADDLGAVDLGCYGNTYNETPNLDRLGREGIRFTQAYAAAPLCSPTRASIMTGKYPARLGITDWIPGDYRPHMPLECPVTKQYLEPSEVTIAEALKEGGYATAYVGKWHLGEAPEHLPQAHGFDIAIADDHKPAGYFPPYKLNHLEDGPKDEYLTDRLGAEAAKLITQLAPGDKPYFLFLGQYAVHAPIVAKPEKFAKYQAKGRDKRSIEYAAMLESLDDSVGVVLDAIENSGEAENTLVIFTSDNGGYYQATENWPLRGYKSNLYEGGLRVPLITSALGRPEYLKGADITVSMPVVSADFIPRCLKRPGCL
jgi:arylsulfatase A